MKAKKLFYNAYCAFFTTYILMMKSLRNTNNKTSVNKEYDTQFVISESNRTNSKQTVSVF